MKYRHWILFAITALSMLACTAQTPPSEPLVTQSIAPDTLDFEDFDHGQFLAFEEALTPWYQAQYFGDCMAVDHFKMNCIDCETVGINVVLQVDGKGNIVNYKGLGPNVYCIGKTHSEQDKQEFYECMLLAIPKLVLTPPFYGKIIRVFIGDHLGC